MSSLARTLLHLFFLPIIWFLYRMRRIGLDRVPSEGGVLLLSNHVSYIDSFIMYFACPRPVQFVVLEKYTKAKFFGWFLTLFGGIPITPEKAKEAIMRTVEALQAGNVVCLFPEGGLTRLGVTTEFKKGFELIVRKAGCPVVPVYMDGLWQSIFSFERGRYIKKWPKRFTCPLQIAFGHPIPGEEANVESVRIAMGEISGEAFAMRRDFDRPLECALIRSLKRNRRQILFSEYGKETPREWSRAQILGVVTAMARWGLKHPSVSGDRIGILLPPGPLAAAMNLGLFLAGKTPVNLPFTVDSRETGALYDAIVPLGIHTVITSGAFMPHLLDFWQGEEGVFIDLKTVLAPLSAVRSLPEKIAAFIEPAWITCWRLDLTSRRLDREAVGFIRRPGDAAIFLRADDLFRNSRSIISANFVQEDDIVFTEEPLSSAEGLTLGCWVPVLGRGRSVCRSFSQRDNGETLEQAIREQEGTLLAGSETFYRGITRAPAIRSLKYGILFGAVGEAEIDAWEGFFDIPLARAWSFDGRIVTMSRPDPNFGDVTIHLGQKGRDPKSVGHLLPGLAGKIEGSRLYLKFPPGREGKAIWIPGPHEVVIAPDGLIYLQNVDLGVRDLT